ncbi:hypothetical protein L486_05245 [Kwoniella mangroviensis CBS 10435]|uniref:Uncharacterized protein n=1 Tax=Kwoniella mangroviensis CBS 10435 TaxID=1331196 RepID=A0A1B9IQR6_9TREE|nr:hypothetical protein L486_05245 [Kwoniella mangroviensis CBS 10435]
MSRPKSAPRASEPALSSRTPSVPIPPTARKSSQPAVNTQSAGATPRFYDGPTISAQGNDVKAKAKQAAAKTAAVTKASTKKAVSTARRHPWSIISILTTLPILVFFSLASTVLCPPPGESLSPVNKYVLSPLGYGPTQSHPILCYPSNVYHREILQPYVYPVLDKAQDRFTASPYYVNYAKPSYDKADKLARQLYHGPLKPVIRGIRRFYFTFIQPHFPYLKARYHTLTAPYTSRIQAFAKPHIESANQYANLASDHAVRGYNYASTHPLTGRLAKYAQKGYQVTSENGHKAYVWSKPHFLRARLEVQRITREILGPRAVKALQRATIEAAKIEAAIRAYIVKIYNQHLEPHVGPYVIQTSNFVAPYTALFHKHVHQPYIKPTVDQLFPPSIKDKSFLTMLAEFLPTTGGSTHAAERKGEMDDYYNDLEHSRKPAEVKVPSADKVAEKKSADVKPQEVKKVERAEMDRVRDAIKSRVDEQGKKSLKKIKEEVGRINSESITNSVPILAQNMRSEIEREIDYILTGLDKLYTKSTSLTNEQVLKSSEQADARLKKTADKIKSRLDVQKGRLQDQAKGVAEVQKELIDRALGKEYKELAEQMGQIDGVTSKDLDKYNHVQKLADSYKSKFASALDDNTALIKPFSELKTELNDYHESFRERVGILKRTALDRIKAREAMSAEAEPSRVSILPIKEAAGAAAAAAGVGAGGILGKGKEQVLSALSAAGTPTSAGVVDQVQASAQSILDAASSSLHEGTRSVISAVGATPSPESPKEHAESVISAASEAVDSLSSAVGSVIHGATRSAISVAGGTPSPESPQEYAESVYNAVVENVNSAISQASDAVHQGTRSIISAVGSTPSPETFGESVESVIAAASKGINDAIPDIDISNSVHDATRAAIKALGATPSPENLGEHIESLTQVLAESASSAISVASEAVSGLSQDASSVLHDATRSAISAVGATPSPESPNEYLESIGNVVAQGAASVYGIAEENVNSLSSNVHDATRSAMKKVGVTPTPETPSEYAESIYGEASSTVSSVGSVISEQASLLVYQIQEALGVVSSTPEPSELVASATSYISSLASAGSSVGSEALVSGSSILSSLQNEASSTIHQATRSASKALGATPSPETPGEYVDAAKQAVKEQVKRVRDPREIAESLVRKHASQIDRDLADERARGTTRFVGDEHGHGHAHTQAAGHAAREEL